MMRGAILVLAATAGAAFMTVPAAARDHTGFQMISSGDYGAAERTLAAERRIFPSRPELMLNLAAVYARTGRASQAAALYQAALVAPAVALEMPGGAILSSRDIARRGQSRLARVEVEVATR